MMPPLLPAVLEFTDLTFAQARDEYTQALATLPAERTADHDLAIAKWQAIFGQELSQVPQQSWTDICRSAAALGYSWEPTSRPNDARFKKDKGNGRMRVCDVVATQVHAKTLPF